MRKYILQNKDYFKGKRVLDCPAVNGVTSQILLDVGASPIPVDLLPEYFRVEGVECIRANVLDGFPLAAKKVDAVICQEGIEHFTDQLSSLKEFNRVLKKNGRILITTPNYSNLRAKLSYLLAESERYGSMMPPNEIDSIWMSKQEITNEIYYGHIFLIGVQKLRVLARLAGLKIKRAIFTRAKTTSLFLLPIFYPLILLVNPITYLKAGNKRKHEAVNTS